MIRSVLYVPADRPKMLVKAAQRHADLVLVDLEDAVAVGSKDLARREARQAIPKLKQEGARVGVRINSHPDHLDPDLDALAGLDLDTIVVPKADLRLIELIADAGALAGTDLTALVESGRGLLDAPSMAAHERVVRLMAGEADMAADLGMSVPPEHPAWLAPRSMLVWASAAAGIEGPIGPVYTNLDMSTLDQLRCSTQELADIGFAGRSAIHPAHVRIINETFTPGAGELEEAHRMVEAYDRAVASGRGIIVDDHGRMIDEAVVRRSRQIVAAYPDPFL
jgi:citrate lyase subunit beta/citryl-CoA lyase